jgi:hypothetical protein
MAAADQGGKQKGDTKLEDFGVLAKLEEEEG